MLKFLLIGLAATMVMLSVSNDAEAKKQRFDVGGGGGMPTRGEVQYKRGVENRTNEAAKNSKATSKPRPECSARGHRPNNC